MNADQLDKKLDELLEGESNWEKRHKIEQEWNRRHPVLAFIKDMRYWPYRFWSRSGDKYRQYLKWPIQRAVRGFDDRAYWGLDSYIGEIALPVLEEYIKTKPGVPVLPSLKEDQSNWDEVTKEWNLIMQKMHRAFYLMKEDDNCRMDYTPENMKAIDEGLELFGKYLRALWD